MAEYVDIDAVKEAVRGAECDADWDGRRFDAEFIENALDFIPRADVAPVVHGRWEKEPSSFWRWTPSGAVVVARTTYRCGLCGRGTAVKSNYCPNCGAKMDIDDGGDNGAAD